jgi:hypothetical protein
MTRMRTRRTGAGRRRAKEKTRGAAFICRDSVHRCSAGIDVLETMVDGMGGDMAKTQKQGTNRVSVVSGCLMLRDVIM